MFVPSLAAEKSKELLRHCTCGPWTEYLPVCASWIKKSPIKTCTKRMWSCGPRLSARPDLSNYCVRLCLFKLYKNVNYRRRKKHCMVWNVLLFCLLRFFTPVKWPVTMELKQRQRAVELVSIMPPYLRQRPHSLLLGNLFEMCESSVDWMKSKPASKGLWAATAIYLLLPLQFLEEDVFSSKPVCLPIRAAWFFFLFLLGMGMLMNQLCLEQW